MGPPPDGGSARDLVSYQRLLRTKLDQQPIQQRIIKIQCVRDLVGFTENRLELRGCFVSQVRQVFGEGTVVQVEMTEPVDDRNQNGWSGRAE